MNDILSLVGNSRALTDIFGAWPSFHDAEVLRLRLDRDGAAGVELEANIYVFEMTGEVTADGFYKLQNQTLATMIFGGLDQLRMEGFNHQNVLFGLSLVDISDRQLDALRWEVSFESSYGVSAQFLCESVAVSAEPYFAPPRGPSPRGTKSPPRGPA
jgi:hypothetical protein